MTCLRGRLGAGQSPRCAKGVAELARGSREPAQNPMRPAAQPSA